MEPAGFSLLSQTMLLTAHGAGFAGSVTADNLNVRSGAGTGYDSVAKLANGTRVTVVSETTGTDGKRWYQISFGSGQNGYVRADYIKQQTTHAASDAAFEQWMNQQGFPESYKNDLRGLHQKFPNWVFKAQKTGLDWNTAVQEESRVGRNLVGKTSKSSWKSTADGAFDWANNSWPSFDGSAWNAASSEIISYYMDPRNFLAEPYIYQFELQSYDAQAQTREGLMSLIGGTFLDQDVLIPLENSRITAGTIVDVPVGTAGSGAGSTGTSGSGTGSAGSNGAAVGPGAGLGSGSGNAGSGVGPGAGLGAGGAAENSGAGAASSSGSGGVSIGAAPSALSLLSGLSQKLSGFASNLSERLFQLLGGMDAFAGSWKKESETPLRWVYRNDDGSLLTNGWNWLDGNGDGVYECYYFYPDGAMAYNATVDGYYVNNDGKWAEQDGTIYTKTAAELSQAPAGNGQEGQSGQNGQSNPGSQNGQSASGTADGSGQQTVQMRKVAYADIIMKAAEVSGVSPYVLASMILQEQGKGTSDSISGTNSSYPGIYNYFNHSAYAQNGMGPVEAGLNFASQSGTGGRPWNSIEKSIIGGAQLYGENYVNAGQDTFYLKKFNVQGSNLYKHQYMTNVPGAAAEGSKICDAYTSALKSTALEFKIPVYENMPAEPCPMPVIDGNPNNKLSQISVEGYALTPTYSMDTQEYSLIVDSQVSSVNISAVTIDSNAKVSGAGTVNLNVGMNAVPIVVTAQNGSTRTYTLNISRREGAAGSGSSGGENGGSTSTGNGGDSVVTLEPSGAAAEGPGSPANETTAGSETQTGSQTAVQNGSDAGAGPGGDGGVLIGSGPGGV